MIILIRMSIMLLFLLCVSCGKKGALIPPDIAAPPLVNALQVVQQGENFRIAWQVPNNAAVAGFRIYRREIRSSNDECPACGAEDLLIRMVDLEYLRDVIRDGNLFTVVDSDVQQGKTYQYQVTAYEPGGAENRNSGRVKRTKHIPPPPPAVMLSDAPAGVMLEWAPVAVKAGTLSGYNVYRLRPGELHSVRPLNREPLHESRYEDLRMEQGIVYRYLVRSAARIGSETVESDASPQVQGRFVLP